MPKKNYNQKKGAKKNNKTKKTNGPYEVYKKLIAVSERAKHTSWHVKS